MSKYKLRFSAMAVALIYILMSMVVLALFSIPIIYSWRQIVDKRITERVVEDVQQFVYVYADHDRRLFDDLIDANTKTQTATYEKFILLASPTLHPLKGNIPAWPSGVPSATGIYRVDFRFNGQTVNAIFITTELYDHNYLIVGRNISHFKRAETMFWYGLSGAAGIIVLFSLLGRWLIRSALLSEIKQISRTASAIIGGDLTRRLPESNGENELNLLAETVNRTLDQVEQLVHANRHVSDSIAHDLRTPLAELRFRLESITLTQPPLERIYEEIDAAILDVDRVILVFNALLRLAEIDYGARRAGFAQVDVIKMVDDVVDFYLPLAELKGITLNFTAPKETITASGDALLLAQAVGNLIDNALKYTHSKVLVEVRKLADTNRIWIRVSDDGIGISDADKPRVTERFYRSNTSRDTAGVGLGLSLVNAVAKLHGGSFELADAHPGLHATLIILPGEQAHA